MTHFTNLVEIGAGDRYSSDALRMIRDGDVSAEAVTLYEPNPILCADLRSATCGRLHSRYGVVVREEAVTSHFDPLYLMGYASYLRGNPSFLATSVEADGEKWWTSLAREVACQKVDRVDYGTIDGLVVTINGGESEILTRLVSRPKVVWTRHRLHNARQWEDAHRTFAWFARNGYVGRQTATNLHSTFAAITWTLDSASQPT